MLGLHRWQADDGKLLMVFGSSSTKQRRRKTSLANFLDLSVLVLSTGTKRGTSRHNLQNNDRDIEHQLKQTYQNRHDRIIEATIVTLNSMFTTSK